MKICIDARWISAQPSGIGVYTRELIRELSRLDTRNQYICLFDSEKISDRTREQTGFAQNRFRPKQFFIFIFETGSNLTKPGPSCLNPKGPPIPEDLNP